MNDDILGQLRETKALLANETLQGKANREKSIVVTKIDEAILWRQEELQRHAAPKDETDK